MRRENGSNWTGRLYPSIFELEVLDHIEYQMFKSKI